VSDFWIELGAVRHLLAEGELLIGRGAEADLQLDDVKVSREHAVLKLHDGALSITDLGSSNGTWVNAQRVEGERELLPGDVVSIGKSTLRVGGSEPEPPPSVSLGVEQIEQQPSAPPPPPRVKGGPTEPHVSTVAVIESLLVSPAAVADPARVLGHVEIAVDRLLAGIEGRGVALVDDDAERVEHVLGLAEERAGGATPWILSARRRVEALRA
jgi:hypothetical protein